MGHLHAREQEAVDLLCYLWKAYKAAPDDEFVVYIKDLKSQCDDGRATFTAEDLMVWAENKYKARLLDKENTWGKPMEDQEKIVAMTVEINSLKKARSSTTTSKPTKQKTATSKTQANKKAQPKKTKEQKKKTNEKWAWKNKPPKDTDSKENNAFVKTFEGKKYYWCLHHNNGAGMWTLHHPNDCEAGQKGKPMEDQEKIVAMTAEINSLKKARSSTTMSKPTKQKAATSKMQANKKAQPKKTREQKKKTNEKWAWKNKPPKDTDSKENNAFVKTFEGKKYYWCLHHNNGAGMWTLHHPNDCEAGQKSQTLSTNANLAAFDTVDSDSERE